MPARVTGLIAAALLAACQARATASPSEEPPGPAGLVIGCLSIEPAECQFVAEHVVAALPAERGPAFAIEITLYPCDGGAACPRTLAVRGGQALVEYADGGEPVTLSLHGPPQSPRIALQAGNSWSGLVQPTSPRVNSPGPFPFELGHCGLSHVIDFDGSFWVPVGQVDGEAPGIINAESGQMRLVAANRALYQGPTGFSAQLARFPGPKHFFLCD